jgi:allantoin racemase
MTKILIVNPNTTTSMTETIGAAARAVAAPGTEISAVTSSMGPVSFEGYYDEAFAVPGLIRALMNAPDADAAIVACFDDTGLDAARTAARFPVVGICEAALVTAGQIAKRIAIVTTLPRSIAPLQEFGAPLRLCGEGAGHRLRRRRTRSRQARLGCGRKA